VFQFADGAPTLSSLVLGGAVAVNARRGGLAVWTSGDGRYRVTSDAALDGEGNEDVDEYVYG